MSDFRFGQSKIVITPPLGTWLVGYPERDHGCEGVHDNLYAKTWVFSDGEDVAALAFLDLTGIDREFAQRVRKEVAVETGLDPHKLHLNYTHSHSAPACFPHPFDDMYRPQGDREYEAAMVRYLAGSVGEAFRSMRKGRIGFGVGHLTGICSNRRDPNGGMDPEVKVIRLEEEDGQMAGAIVNYACHPTILHEDNYLVSRDLPGEMCDAVERGIGSEAPIAYAQGAAADTGTRWTRRGTTFAETRRLGQILAGEAMRVLQGIETTPEISVKSFSREVELPTRRFPSVEEAERRLAAESMRLERLKAAGASYGETRSAYAAKFGATRVVDYARRQLPPTVTSEVGLVWLGETPIAILPSETFARIGMDVKAALGERTIVLGYSNDSLGYLVPPEEEKRGGYEVNTALLSSAASEILREAVIGLARQDSG
jgi:hypothetical protein